MITVRGLFSLAEIVGTEGMRANETTLLLIICLSGGISLLKAPPDELGNLIPRRGLAKVQAQQRSNTPQPSVLDRSSDSNTHTSVAAQGLIPQTLGPEFRFHFSATVNLTTVTSSLLTFSKLRSAHSVQYNAKYASSSTYLPICTYERTEENIVGSELKIFSVFKYGRLS